MKNVVLLALLGGFLVGSVSGYFIRPLIASESAQEKLAKSMLEGEKETQKNWANTKGSVKEMLGR